MPPKPKYTREEIAKTALAIVKENGLDTLTARTLGKRLGMSASPVFTFFQSMEEVKDAARELALQEFRSYISDYRSYTPAFKRIGMMMVSYGMHEPELFKLLFMRPHSEKAGFHSTIHDLGEIADVCIELAEKDYSLPHDLATVLFEQLWTHAFGLGALCALGVCTLTEEEIGRRLSVVFAGLVMLIRSGKIDLVPSGVENRSDGIFLGMPLGEMPY